MKNDIPFLKINPRSIVPKYKQLANALLKTLESGNFEKEEILPSLHEICTSVDISKSGAEKAYELLKKQGIVGSVKGKGFYLK